MNEHQVKITTKSSKLRYTDFIRHSNKGEQKLFG